MVISLLLLQRTNNKQPLLFFVVFCLYFCYSFPLNRLPERNKYLESRTFSNLWCSDDDARQWADNMHNKLLQKSDQCCCCVFNTTNYDLMTTKIAIVCLYLIDFGILYRCCCCWLVFWATKKKKVYIRDERSFSWRCLRVIITASLKLVVAGARKLCEILLHGNLDFPIAECVNTQ